MLRKGGTAADAMVTAQAVLGLVGLQSSGLGGGGFLLYHDSASGTVQAYDGRDPLVAGLRALGHQVDLTAQSSGLSAIVRD